MMSELEAAARMRRTENRSRKLTSNLTPKRRKRKSKSFTPTLLARPDKKD